MFSTLVKKGSKYLGEIREEVKLISAAVGEGRSAVKLARSEITALSKAGEAVSAAQAARIAAAEKNAERVTSNLVSLEKNAARISAEERASRAVSIVEKPNGAKVLQVDPNIHIPEVKPSQLGYTPHGIDKITDKAALRAMIGEEKAAKMGLHEIENVVELRNKVKKFLDEEGRLFNKDNSLVRAANNVAVNGTRAVAKRERSASQESDDLMGCIIQRGGQQAVHYCPPVSTPTPTSGTPGSGTPGSTKKQGKPVNIKDNVAAQNELKTAGMSDPASSAERKFYNDYMTGQQYKIGFSDAAKAAWQKLPPAVIDVLTIDQLKIYIRCKGVKISKGIRGQPALSTIAKTLQKGITPTNPTSSKLLEEFQETLIKELKELKAAPKQPTGSISITDFLALKTRSTVSNLYNSELRQLEKSGFTAFSKTTPPNPPCPPCEVDHIAPVHAICACLQKVMKDKEIAISESTLERLSKLLNHESNLEWILSDKNKQYGREIQIGITEILKGDYKPPPKTDGMRRLQKGLERMVDRTFHLNDNSKAFNAIEHLYDVVKGPVKTPFLTGGGTNEELEEIKNIMEKFVIGLETGNFDEKTKEFAQIYYATINDEEEDKQDDDEEEYIEPRSKVFSNILNPEEPAEEPVAQPQAQPQVQPQVQPQAQPQVQTKVSASTGLSTPPAPRQGGTRKNRPYNKSNTYHK
jgi:hypothetical protein